MDCNTQRWDYFLSLIISNIDYKAIAVKIHIKGWDAHGIL
jgi:hypothetical protein